MAGDVLGNCAHWWNWWNRKGPRTEKGVQESGSESKPEKRKKEHNTRSCPISRWLEEVLEIRVQMTSRFILKM